MISTILASLADNDPAVQLQALYQASTLDETERSEPLCLALAAQLDSAIPLHRELAAESLHALAGSYPALLPAIARALGDSVARVRERIVGCFRHCPAEERFRPGIAALLADSDCRVRLTAARTLLESYHDDQGILPVVRDGLACDQPDCICLACQLAARLPAQSELLRPALRERVHHADDQVRGNALHSLARLGEDPSVLLSLCGTLQHDPSAFVRYEASRVVPHATG